MSEVRVRIAPSPTGFFHIGTARTALYNYLYAKKMGGVFVLRIEDTDKERGSAEYENDVYEEMAWLGLSFDEKYIQSEHVERHKELLRQLVEKDAAYISKEPRKDDPTKMVEVVRLRNPGTVITFNDAIRGDISFDTTELKDFVIARSIDDPLYHFAVVADDGDARITHVIRGEDHISNTPRQILIQEALGLPRPIYAHLPLILAPDRSKMSKRKHQTSIKDFRERGYLPEAMLNFMALLGWSAGEGDRELFTMQDLISHFDLAHIHSGGAVFNEEKLRWFNREYLLQLEDANFQKEARSHLESALRERVQWDETVVARILPLIKERISIWDDIRTLVADGEFDYFFNEPVLDSALLPGKKSDAAIALKHLKHAEAALESLHEDSFNAEEIKSALWEYATEEGRGAVLWPLRYALSGREKSPDPFALASILGKEKTLKRLHTAQDILV
ncbi:MAG: glutamate--tRNA ligase [Minisyncoccia bacterium]